MFLRGNKEIFVRVKRQGVETRPFGTARELQENDLSLTCTYGKLRGYSSVRLEGQIYAARVICHVHATGGHDSLQLCDVNLASDVRTFGLQE